MRSSLWQASLGRQMRGIVFGTALVIGGLAYYQGLSNLIPAGAASSGLLVWSGYTVVALCLAGLGSSFWGLTRLIQKIGLDLPRNSSLTIGIISMVARERPYSLVFALAAVTYGLVFSISSSIIVYQPGVAFSSAYGVSVPSMVEVICCGPFGQMPQFVLYLTQNIALLFIPINAILLLAISWLVGLNVSLTVFAFRNRQALAASGWLGSFGAFVGLFSACPTCAGFFLLSIVGLSSGLSLSLVFSPTQEIFVASGLSLLLLTPLIIAKRLGKEGRALCRLPK